MRLRRIEFIALSLTLAFVCFMGGYFAGSRGSVNIVAVDPQYGVTQQISTTGMSEAASSPAPNTAVNVGSVQTPPAAAAEDTDTEDLGGTSPAVSAHGSGEAAGAPKGGDGRININSASRSELMDLPGIGSVLAERIMEYRNQYGAFSKIEDIKRVSGIGEKRFESIMDKITVG